MFKFSGVTGEITILLFPPTINFTVTVDRVVSLLPFLHSLVQVVTSNQVSIPATDVNNITALVTKQFCKSRCNATVQCKD